MLQVFKCFYIMLEDRVILHVIISRLDNAANIHKRNLSSVKEAAIVLSHLMKVSRFFFSILFDSKGYSEAHYWQASCFMQDIT